MSTRDSTPWNSLSDQGIPIPAHKSDRSLVSSGGTGYFSTSSSRLSSSSTRSTQHYACASPSWPSGLGFTQHARRPPTSYVSDEDLFGLDDAPRMREAPPPPRTAAAWLNGAAPVGAAPGLVRPVQPAANVNTSAADWRRKTMRKAVSRTKSSSSSASTSSSGSKN